MAAAYEEEILEGFLCPICKADLKSAAQLTSHFESLHSEDQDVLRSLKEIFGKAKKIILNNEDSDLKETFDRVLKIPPQDSLSYPQEEQKIGLSRSYTDYYKGVRSARLERYATETNKLIIRLDKLLRNMPSDAALRKQHEQNIVPWLDGSSVKLCPNCAKAFNLTRRKHHCRLCGSLLCHDCCIFLDLNVARTIVDPSAPPTSAPQETMENNGLRLCEHCHNLIELRRQIQESRNAKTVLMTGYEEMMALIAEARPAVEEYTKICQALYSGESGRSLAEANAARARVARLAGAVEGGARRLAALPAAPGSRQDRLLKAVRLAASQFIKEELMSLEKLPTDAQIEEVRRERYERAERAIQRERERAREHESTTREHASTTHGHACTTRGHAGTTRGHDDDSPLLEQMNIIRGYIKEARREGRSEEVAILETNLKELKKEYQLQMLSYK